mmetsp:Transcript_24719/g.67374  ORF Transcript_24719/g.67374 Transcript_24719/m.67374 type:complete len:260 (+) Transcript_24719:639-1418(+)
MECGPVLRIVSPATLNEAPEASRRQVGEGRPAVLTRNHMAQQGFCNAVKGLAAGEQLPASDAEGIHVGGLGHSAFQQDFWCHMRKGALKQAAHVRRGIFHAHSQPKISNLAGHPTAFSTRAAQHHILRFQVCVHHVVAVQVQHRPRNVRCRVQDSCVVQPGVGQEDLLIQRCAEAAAVAVLDHQADLVAVQAVLPPLDGRQHIICTAFITHIHLAIIHPGPRAHYDSTGVSASILERAMHSVNDGLNAVGIGLHNIRMR